MITLERTMLMTSDSSQKNPCSVSPEFLLRMALMQIPSMNARATAAVTSITGLSGMVKKGLSIPASGSPMDSTTELVMNWGNRVMATAKAMHPATMVDPYARPPVISSNFPAPWLRSAIPMVTNARIMMGMTKRKKELNNAEAVITVRFSVSGA